MLKDSQYPKFVFYSPGDLYEAVNINILYLQISKEVNLLIYQHKLTVDSNGITNHVPSTSYRCLFNTDK